MKKNRVNEAFFDSWSADMAYILGYVFGDGFIYQQPRRDKVIYTMGVCAHVGDAEFLASVRDKMGCTARIEFPKGNICMFRVASKQLYDSLRKLGKLGRFEEMVFPEMPELFIRDFIRGYLDADGYVGKVRARYSKVTSKGKHFYDYMVLRLQFSSSRVNFLRQLNKVISIRLGMKERTLKEGVTSLCYSNGSALSVFRWLYYEGCFALNRKSLIDPLV